MPVTTEPPRPPDWLPGYPPPPAAYPFPYPGLRQARSRLRQFMRGIVVALAVITGALIVLCFLAYLIAPASTFVPDGDRNAAESAVGSTGADGSVTSRAAWPADLAPFSALIGTGASSDDGWNGAPCQPTSLGSTGELHTVICPEPDGVTLFLSTFSTASDVQHLISGAAQSGGTATSWTAGGQALGETVTNTANGDTTITTTFNHHPTALVMLMDANPSTVTTDWQSAPLPH
jgi:hypothetical protein